MPLVAYTELPTFERLRREGQTVLAAGRARQQEVRALHVGLLNMMPDTALEATERQFYRLVGESNPIAQFYMHPFTLPELPRGRRAREHIARYYETFDKIREDGLDALIITGANVTHPDLSQEAFRIPLIEVVDWAAEHVTSTLCSCLATHAVMQFRYGQARRAMPAKRWGVFRHCVVERSHPLVNDVNTSFDVPHSRFNDISRSQFETAGVHVLVESEAAGVHLAVSEDGFCTVFFQGHPEYDTISLLKEYKREVMRYATGERPDRPPFVDNHFSELNRAVLTEYLDRIEKARSEGAGLPPFPEHLLIPNLHNTWHDTAEAIVGNWIGLVYQITHQDRELPLMDDVDPADPLGWLRTRSGHRGD
ncbi:MAG: homoserine O-succinyltransferase [Gammaproteobacteria bacterium]|jgi:homoserine O-succinyltransferase|nr:homoserine O-succinyltransferase [Gammaproteobacteria bacterium]